MCKLKIYFDNQIHQNDSKGQIPALVGQYICETF